MANSALRRPETLYSGPPVARSERFTTPALDGVSLHAIRHGDPRLPKLVLLHGGGANAHWWDDVAPVLARRYHVVALDFRGHGDSDQPEPRPGAFQWDLVGLLEHIEAPDAALLGHSMGGHVVLEHAARHGGAKQPRALVVVDVARGAGGRTRRMMRLALAARRSYRTREEAISRFRFLPPAPGASEELRARIAAASVRQQPDGRFAFKFDPRWFALPPAPGPLLERVSAPTLILRGAESPILSREGAQSLARELPEARLVEIAGAEHNVHLEQPEKFLSAVEGFLAEVHSSP
jgi:pimeloyl-ACP methyl ester carboxylesterase